MRLSNSVPQQYTQQLLYGYSPASIDRHCLRPWASSLHTHPGLLHDANAIDEIVPPTSSSFSTPEDLQDDSHSLHITRWRQMCGASQDCHSAPQPRRTHGRRTSMTDLILTEQGSTACHHASLRSYPSKPVQRGPGRLSCQRKGADRSRSRSAVQGQAGRPEHGTYGAPHEA